MNTSSKQRRRVSRHLRVRAKIKGDTARPRVAVFKSNRFTYAQVIDDATGKTLVAVSDYAGKKSKAGKGTKTQKASLNGKALAEALKKKGIEAVVFDRGGFKYHGRVKALAEGLREAGIKM